MRLRQCTTILAAATLAALPIVAGSAQLETGSKDLLGTWVYRLGPNTLVALHLEADKNDSNRVHGFLLRPEHFNMNSPGGSVMRFSNIANQSVREPIISTGFKDGALQLTEESPSSKPEERAVYIVRMVDANHIDFTLFQPLQPLRMEETTDQPRLANNWDSERTYSPDDFVPDNPNMAQIIAADQADRKDGMHIDWQKVKKADDERRTTAAVLLSEGKLHTGHDFESAALVFQHGEKPDDYLLAHALAIVAISKGQSGAVWICAATLDRYLQAIHQPQIFGTQYATPEKQPTTQEPYNPALVSDSLRGYMGVPTKSEQDAQRHQYDIERGISAGATPTVLH